MLLKYPRNNPSEVKGEKKKKLSTLKKYNQDINLLYICYVFLSTQLYVSLNYVLYHTVHKTRKIILQENKKYNAHIMYYYYIHISLHK